MRILLIITLLFNSGLIKAQGTLESVEISGIPFPTVLGTEKVPLYLNGGGVRQKYMMDMYVAGLYLRNKSQDPARIISGDEPMLIRLKIVSGLITSDKMKSAVEEGFAKSSPGQTEALRPRIDQFIATYNEEIQKGDVFDMIYIPGKGTVITKNGKTKATIEGKDFKEGLFGIWLCDKPADAKLKEGLLGKDK